jgi:hypothetical protein
MSSKKRKYKEIVVVNKNKGEHRYCKTRNCICTLGSHPKVKFWDYDKNENIHPGDIPLGRNNKLYWFHCEECGHDIEKTPLAIKKGTWCKYCSETKWEHCGDKKCKYCFEQSFASHPLVKYWDYDKNTISPLNIRQKTDDVIFFKCDKCPHSFSTILKNVTCHNSWCPFCSTTNWKHVRMMNANGVSNVHL